MVRWADVEEVAPELAEVVRERIEQFGFVLAGTIRRDGTPRISPVEAHFVGDQLMLVMLPGSFKARDLLRDSRIVLNTPIVSAGDPGLECKLRGRTQSVDETARAATAAAIAAASGWRPGADWHFFSLDVDDVTAILWKDGAMDLTRWTRTHGLRRSERPAPLLEDAAD